MRVITCNLNGIRSAARKGFFHWLRRQKADVVCLQELKAQVDQLTDSLFWPPSFHCYYHPAERKGYSGVGIYCRREPDEVIEGIGWPVFDREGRWIEARFGNLCLVSLYLPSGSSGEARQQVKFEVLDRLLPYLVERRQTGQEMILCGDLNIAHRKEDLKNWRGNQKNSGFLPEERAWMDRLFGAEGGFVDAFRRVNQETDQYTWWSNRGRARENNVGWRIDYQVTTPAVADRVRAASIYKRKWFSDHAPLIMDYDLD
ncbi:MAG: exodeoxyribonuclease III [Gammaproteobacteria bacterium]|nr:MAG: exodeoxyribonuclease III [Gammaproteobacteria bacterium]